MLHRQQPFVSFGQALRFFGRFGEAHVQLEQVSTRRIELESGLTYVQRVACPTSPLQQRPEAERHSGDRVGVARLAGFFQLDREQIQQLVFASFRSQELRQREPRGALARCISHHLLKESNRIFSSVQAAQQELDAFETQASALL